MKKSKPYLSVSFLFLLCTNINAQSWWTQTSNTTVNLTNINFFDDHLGYAFGDTMSTIVKTGNQGALWSGLSPTFTRGDLRSSAFLNASTVIAVGIHDVAGGRGVVMKTTNGGTSWAADTTITEQLFDVSFVNSTNGWISGENGYIARTDNGGTSWLQLTTGTGEDFFSLYFVNANEGWAVGTVTTDAIILHTTNAGTAWTEQVSGITDQLHSVFFVDTLTGWAVGENGKIIATTDGGNTWAEQTSGTLNDLFDVCFLDANKGWAVGGGGTILKTADGGASWLPDSGGTAQDIHSIHMRHDSLGWFCTDGGIIKVYGMSPPSAIHEIDKRKPDIEVYPNPSTQWLSINLNNDYSHWYVAIYDLTGRLVLEKNQINKQQIVINRSDLNSGLYFLKVINSKGQIHSEKIVFK